MALARLALRSMQQRVSTALVSPSPSVVNKGSLVNNLDREPLRLNIVRSFAATAGGDAASGSGEVAVAHSGEGQKSSNRLASRRNRRRHLWRNDNRDTFVPALYEFFPSGLGDALVQASNNVSRLFDQLSPSRLLGHIKEKDECYKLRFDMPGLSKEDVKITVENGVLYIKGEHKEDEDQWHQEYQYDTSLVLPDDAKVDEIKAEMKDGALTLLLPKSPKHEKEVQVVQIQ
ncbi:Alpha crystallin/Hsp20 domain [Dillenia turbinata]|uniref:Alpha crystallin/Hsp20 domain n=1 Tax=Dillenia turbinata TaxID=194707 RepID=A0AAN8YWG7_9MAGN